MGRFLGEDRVRSVRVFTALAGLALLVGVAAEELDRRAALASIPVPVEVGEGRRVERRGDLHSQDSREGKLRGDQGRPPFPTAEIDEGEPVWRRKGKSSKTRRVLGERPR